MGCARGRQDDRGGHLHAGQDVACDDAIACGQGLKAGGSVIAAKALSAGCGIQAGASVDCGEHLAAGWGMIAGEDIRAEGAIRAGEGIQAQGAITAGPGHGIYAGLNVRLDAWPVCARVIASERPSQLVSGHWEARELNWPDRRAPARRQGRTGASRRARAGALPAIAPA